MTLNGENGEMALILRYFTEFGSFRAHGVNVVDKAIYYWQFTITMSSSKRLQGDRVTAWRPYGIFLADS